MKSALRGYGINVMDLRLFKNLCRLVLFLLINLFYLYVVFLRLSNIAEIACGFFDEFKFSFYET